MDLTPDRNHSIDAHNTSTNHNPTLGYRQQGFGDISYEQRRFFNFRDLLRLCSGRPISERNKGPNQ